MASVAANFRAHDALIQFRKADTNSQNTLDRLSSGERLRRSHEDVVDFRVSNNLRSEITSLRQVKRSNFDATNAIQIADNTLEEAINNLERIMEIGTRSASDTLGGDNSFAKQANDAEFQDLVAELTLVNDSVRYNGQQLFGPTGFNNPVMLNTSDSGNPADSVTLQTQPFDGASLGLTGQSLLTSAGANIVIENASIALANLARQRGQLGTVQKRLIDNMDVLDQKVGFLQEQESRIRDADIAEEATANTRHQLMIRSSTAVMAQANLTSEAVFQLIG